MSQVNLPFPGMRPWPVTPLDPVETPVEPDPSSTLPGDLDSDLALHDNFRHSGWRPDRAKIWAAFQDLNVSHARREAFRVCGSSFWIQRHRTERDRYRLIVDHCHDRLCVPCGHSRQAVIRRNAHTLVRDHPHRFLTLTIRNVGEDLNTMLNHLYTSFRKLRQRGLWRRRVFGGVAFCELTYNPELDTWNPHLHCILDGYYMDRPDLTQAWLAVTGDSFNVHIRLIRTKRSVVEYVTKYATKPIPHNVIAHPEALREAIHALKRRRLVLTFGTWRHFKFLENPSDKDWELVDHASGIKLRALEGSTWHENILSMMRTADPYSGEFHVHDDGPAIDDSS